MTSAKQLLKQRPYKNFGEHRHLRPNSQPVVLTQPDKGHANRTVLCWNW